MFAFGQAGKDEGQLWYPRKIAVLRDSGHFVICDRGSERSRMQIFSPLGHFIRRIPIRFIDIVAGLAISREGFIVAVDSVTPTIFILHESGELIRYIECSEYMTEPSDIAIFGSEYYICDFKGHSIVVMHEDGRFIRRIGCQPVTNFPNGIDISDAGDILVGDSHGNMFHVAVYDRRGELISQFQCPQVTIRVYELGNALASHALDNSFYGPCYTLVIFIIFNFDSIFMYFLNKTWTRFRLPFSI